MCHDEPRDTPQRKSKGGDGDPTSADEPVSPKPEFDGQPRTSVALVGDSNGQTIPRIGSSDVKSTAIDNNSVVTSSAMHQAAPPNESVASQGRNNPGRQNPNGLLILGLATSFNLNDQWTQQNRVRDISSFHPSYMFNANEINDEYNLFNDFLSTSLFDETGMFSTEDMTALNDPSFANSMNVSMSAGNVDLLSNMQGNQNVTNQQNPAIQDPMISRPASAKPVSDKAREKYYMTAADPAGTDSPEERMNKLLKAKYDAGLLKPFNYLNGYARLNKFMEKTMRPSSRHKILMQLDRFRPKFRERMQSLTDIELVLVEMWFERSLMEYDRVFASMAIPACCWRRTGEVFRGNREMAELIHVPIESLRDVRMTCEDDRED